MWSIDFYDDPLTLSEGISSHLVLAKQPLSRFPAIWEHCQTAASSPTTRNGKNNSRNEAQAIGVAFADYISRHVLRNAHHTKVGYTLEPLALRRKYNSGGSLLTPYMLERTDIFINKEILHVYLRLVVVSSENNTKEATMVTMDGDTVSAVVSTALDDMFSIVETALCSCLKHIATAVFQERLREYITPTAVAFVANGSILPRKSGSSSAPMASPPAIPFVAPREGTTSLRQTISIDMGSLARYLELPKGVDGSTPLNDTDHSSTCVTLSGILIPKGVSLIVGGGYHGKSTLLRCIAAGVYNKIPDDGREFCVTVQQALTIRAEDGRYVSSCNVSAFITNLPTPSVDTTKFSTREASGSTSQAANVVEAIEMGSTAFLVDEDVSAANFMARDGRMRALVMDESITPFLYRVNGIFASLGISSIVVVGGVGDWLDVPDAVILMDKYLCKDATAKARSISRQFSHGHVQYAGRGVVHRLPWEKSGTPAPRRPILNINNQEVTFQCHTTQVAIMDGHQTISLENVMARNPDRIVCNGNTLLDEETDDDESRAWIDLSRIEQLLGRKAQLYGCGLCVSYILDRATRTVVSLSLAGFLKELDDTIDNRGLLALLEDPSPNSRPNLSPAMQVLIRSIGFAYRPRSLEVGQALARLQCVRFEELPLHKEEDSEDEKARTEAQRKQQELMELWNSRRKKRIGQ